MLIIFKLLVAMFVVLAGIISYRFWNDHHRWISLGYLAVAIATAVSVSPL